MIYLLLNESQIKILFVKKTLLGQYDIVFYEKNYQLTFIKNGQLANPDLTASAIKEALTLVSNAKMNDKDVTLILPQSCFEFIRSEVPGDMSPSVLETYIREKARTQIKGDIETYHTDSMVVESEGNKQMTLYALENEVFLKFTEPFTLLDLKVKSVIPETLSYYKLFEKTLRTEKKENIFYVRYDGPSISGYVFDSFGLLDEKKWNKELKEKDSIEDVLKTKSEELEKSGVKLNRLILSGEESENVRQDTFTKNVGVWTNPLKRIIPHFYADYLKMFSTGNNKSIPYLQFDACIGAFIFSTENKTFSILNKNVKDYSAKTYKSSAPSIEPSLPPSGPKRSFSLPWKPIGIGIAVFAVVVGIFYGISQFSKQEGGINLAAITSNLPFAATPTQPPTPTPEPPSPTPTPTPSIEREEVNIKVLNGSGTPGKAGDVRDVLNELGYENVLTGNADSFDYENTVIQVSDENQTFADVLLNDLSDNVDDDSVDLEDIPEDEVADVILIVGTDFR